MVSTRSQDHTPAGVGTRLMKEVGSSNVTSGKSKQEDGVGPSPAQAVTKGRRISSTSKSELVSVVIPATPTGNALAEKTMASVEELPELRSKDQEPSVKDECSRSPTTPAQNTARGRPKSSISKRKKLSQNNTDSTSGNTTTESVNGVTRAFPDAGVADHEEPKKRSRPKTSKKSTLVPYPSADAGEGSNLANNNPPTFNLKVVGRQDKKQEEDIVDHGNGKPIVVKESKEVSPSPADRRKVIANVAKPKHKRFGSEDAVETAPQFATGGAESEHRSSAAENEESEDDAPETVTVSAGFDEARTSAIKAAKLAAK